MIASDAIVLPPEATGDVKTYARIGGSDEDVLIGALLRTASELCEQFSGQVLIARGFSEVMPASAVWQRLARTPARAIVDVEALAADGTPTPLPSHAYAIDIDANGDGWVRATGGGGPAPRVRVRYEAGIAANWSDAPEALRQGIVRLATHLFVNRSGGTDEGPPAAVTALWRPWRRMPFGEGRPVR